MSKIVSIDKAIKISKKLRHMGQTLVVSGGCFDILHIGHINFLKNAKKQGNFLFLLLESDEAVKKLKGAKRPLNNQLDRAEILSTINSVDYVVLLDGILKDVDYDKIIVGLKPAVLAATKMDPKIKHIKRQARLVNAKVLGVIARLPNYSSTGLAKLIGEI